MRRAVRSLLFALPLLLAGCPHGLRFGPEGEITDPAYVLRRLEARASRVRSLKAEARITLRTPQQSGTVTELVAALRPASLHLETLNFFGKPVAALATDGARLAFFAEETATFYSGPASAANIGKLLPIAVEPSEAVSLLLGEVPLVRDAEARLELDRDARAYRLTLARGGVTQQIWLRTEDLRPLRSTQRGTPGYNLTFNDYQVIEGHLMPMAIDVKAVRADGSDSGTEVDLRYKDVALNVDLNRILFTLEPPAGARAVELDASGREIGPRP